mmetsp:Transcript_8021/g.7098  ORF Transcript_8021/g.7098 Transcript_8021/m.7098 type:complete len:326 (-) Transcript_8021:28-1005(-)
MHHHPYFIYSKQLHDMSLNPKLTKFWKYEIVATEKGRNYLSTILETVDKIISIIGEENLNSMNSLLEVGDLVKKELDIKKADFETPIDIEYDDEDTKYLYQRLLNLNFPSTLLDSFKSYWCLSDEFIFQVFLNYLKYLVIATLNNYEVSPDFWTDQLWHTHMQHCKHYRETCNLLKNTVDAEMTHLNFEVREFIPHLPGDKSLECQERLEALNEMTISLYKKHFNDYNYKNIWEEQKDYVEDDSLITVNILGLIHTNNLHQNLTRDKDYLYRNNYNGFEKNKKIYSVLEYIRPPDRLKYGLYMEYLLGDARVLKIKERNKKYIKD